MNWNYANKYGELPSGQAEQVEALVEIAEQLERIAQALEKIATQGINVRGAK